MAEQLAVSTVSKQNQITIPKEVRDHLGIGEGEKIYWFKGTKERQVIIVREVKIG